MNKDEALKLALVALEEWYFGCGAGSESHDDAVEAIKQALAAQPAPVQGLPFGVGGGLVAIKTLLGRDPCVHANTAIEMIDAILKEHPAAQPAVQEPYKGLSEHLSQASGGMVRIDPVTGNVGIGTPEAQPAVQEGRDWSLLEATQESLREHMAEIKRLKAAQPVPVKTYSGGKPWPVAPKPWVGLTDDDIHEQGWNLSADRDYEAWTGREFLVVNGVNDFARAIEAKLKEKNHG
jgi:hypothetical protein